MLKLPLSLSLFVLFMNLFHFGGQEINAGLRSCFLVTCENWNIGNKASELKDKMSASHSVHCLDVHAHRIAHRTANHEKSLRKIL